MTHTLSGMGENLHGVCRRDRPAVLTVRSGDAIEFDVPDAVWCDGKPTGPWPWRMIAHPEAGLGHCLLGPVAVEHAKPGMTLRITFERLTPGRWGWTTLCLGEDARRRLGIDREAECGQLWTIDPQTRLARGDSDGRRIAVRPFLGWVGCAAPDPGELSTTPPRRWGGNLDCPALTEGSSLLLAVGVEGAMLSLGDGHAAQGDGELAGAALECPMSGRIRVQLIDDIPPPPAPRIELPDGDRLALGLGLTLDDAADHAQNNALDWLTATRGISRARAMVDLSLAGWLSVTQRVNQTVGAQVRISAQIWD